MAQTEAGEALNLQFVNYPYAQSVYIGNTDISNEGKNTTMTSYSGLKYEYCEGMGSDKIKLDMHFGNGKDYHVKAIHGVNIPTPFDNGNYYSRSMASRPVEP